MTKRPHSHIMLHDSRMAQLRALAGDKGNVTEALEALIDIALNLGLASPSALKGLHPIPDVLPGLEVGTAGARVTLRLGDAFNNPPPMSATDATELADKLEAVADNGGRHLVMLKGK